MVAIDQLLAEQKTTDEMARKAGEYIRLFQSSGIPVRRYDGLPHETGALWPLFSVIAAPLACAAGSDGFGVFISILVAFAYVTVLPVR